MELHGDPRVTPYHGFSLQRHTAVLSTSMPSSLVEQLCCCLYQQRTITSHEKAAIRSKPSDMHRAAELILIILRKGRAAGGIFYRALERLDPKLYERVTGVPASRPAEKPACPLQGAQDTVFKGDAHIVAPTCIINIHNSTLSNCIIGNNNDQVVTQSQLCQQAAEDALGSRCTCSQGAVQPPSAPPSIKVQDSSLKYVIIGAGSSLTVEEVLEPDEEEQ